VYEIDLGNGRPLLAIHPNLDKVVPLDDVGRIRLTGCFIGGCATTEENLVVAALVLQQGLKTNRRPFDPGKRIMVPGSMWMLHRLREKWLLQFYEKAGFEISEPGCSYCAGIYDGRAAAGEFWLSSQSRSFEQAHLPAGV
jgi:homoaconitase/3-isopropylmalate dehydratase large subunit